MVLIGTLTVNFVGDTSNFDAAVARVTTACAAVARLNPTVRVSGDTRAVDRDLANLRTEITRIQRLMSTPLTMRTSGLGTVEADLRRITAELTRAATAATAFSTRAGPGLRAYSSDVRRAGQDTWDFGDRLRAVFEYQIAGKIVNQGLDILKSSFFEFNSLMQTSAITVEHFADAAGKGFTEVQQHMQQLRDFAAATPFELKDLVKIDAKMQGLGFQMDKTVQMMNVLGNQAAAMGQGPQLIERMTLSMGQMMARGKLTGEELKEMGHAGVDALEALSIWFDKSKEDMKKAVKDGMVPAKEAFAALMDYMEKRNDGLMQAQVKTFQGAISNLKDIANQGIGDATMPFFDALTKALVRFSDYIQGPEVRGALRDFADQMTDVNSAFGNFLDRLSGNADSMDRVKEFLTVGASVAAGWAAYTVAAPAIAAIATALTSLTTIAGLQNLAAWLLAISPAAVAVGAAVGLFAYGYIKDIGTVRDETHMFLDRATEAFANFAEYLAGLKTFENFKDQALVDLADFTQKVEDVLILFNEDHLKPVTRKMWEDLQYEYTKGLLDIYEPMFVKFDEIREGWKNFVDSLLTVNKDGWPLIVDNIAKALGNLTDKFKDFFSKSKDGWSRFIDAIKVEAGLISQDEYGRKYGGVGSGAPRDGVNQFGIYQGRSTRNADGSPNMGFALSQSDAIVQAQQRGYAQIDDITVDEQTAKSICGPILAQAMAKYYGKNIPLSEVMAAARKYGWKPGAGMAGGESEARTLSEITGMPFYYKPKEQATGAWWDQFQEDVHKGMPYGVSTNKHYFAIYGTRLNPNGEQAFYTGNTGLAMAGQHNPWMTLAEIDSVGGGIQGYVYGGSQANPYQDRSGGTDTYGPALPPGMQGVDAARRRQAQQDETIQNARTARSQEAIEKAQKIVAGVVERAKQGLDNAYQGGHVTDAEYARAMAALEQAYQHALTQGSGSKEAFWNFLTKGADAPFYPGDYSIPEDKTNPQYVRNRDFLLAFGNENYRKGGWAGTHQLGAGKEDDIAKKAKSKNAQIKAIANLVEKTFKANFPKWTDKQVRQATLAVLAVAYNESGGFDFDALKKPTADSQSPGSLNYGIFQFNDKYSGYTGDFNALLDPMVATGAALNKYFLPAAKQGARSVEDFYYNYGALSINSNAPNSAAFGYKAGVDKKLNDALAAVTGIMQSEEPDQYADEAMRLAGKRKGKGASGDPLQYGMQIISQGTAAMKMLSSEYVPGMLVNVEPFFDDVTDIVKAMVKAAEGLDPLLQNAKLDNFTEFADLAIKIVSNGINAFKAFEDFIPPTEGDIGGFFEGLDQVIAAIKERSTDASEELATKGELFTTVVGQAIAIVTEGSKAFTTLMDAPPPGADIITEYFADLDVALAAFKERLPNYSEEMVTGATAFMRAVGAVSGTMKNGADAFKALWSAIPVDQAQVNAFVDSIDMVVHTFAAAYSRLGVEEGDEASIGEQDDKVNKISLTRLAKKFAQNAEALTKPIKGGVDALNSLWSLAPVDMGQVMTFVGGVESIVYEFARAQQLLGIEPGDEASAGGSDARRNRRNLMNLAEAFAKQAEALTKPIKSAVDALNSLWHQYPVQTASVQTFVAGVGLIADAFAAVARDITQKAQRAQPFVTAVESLTKPIGSAVDSMNKLLFAVKPNQQNIDDLVGGIMAVAEKFAEYGPRMQTSEGKARMFVTAANLVVQPLKEAIDAFGNMWKVVAVDPAQVENLVGWIDTTLRAFAERASDPSALQKAQLYGQTAKAVVEPISGAVEAFRILYRLVEPTEQQVKSLTKGIGMVLDAFVEAGGGYNAKQTTEATQFANTGKAALEAVKIAEEVLKSLSYFEARPFNVAPLKDAIVQVLDAFREPAGGLGKADADKLTQFSQTASAAVGAIKATLEAWSGINKFAAAQPGQLARVKEAIGASMVMLLGMGSAFDQPKLDKVNAVATAVNAAGGAMKSAIDGLARVNQFATPNPAKLAAVDTALRQIMDSFGGLYRKTHEMNISPDDLGKIGNAVGAIVAPIKTAVEASNALYGFEKPDPARVEAVLSVLVDLVERYKTRLVPLLQSVTGDPAQYAALLGAVVDAFAKTGETVAKLGAAEKVDMSRVNALVDATLDTYDKIVPAIAERFKAGVNQEGLDQMAQFGGIATQAVEQFAKTAEALTKLTSVPTFHPEELAPIFASAGAATDALLDLAAQHKASNAQINVDQVTKVAGVVSQAVGILGNTAESLKKLSGYVAPPRYLFTQVAKDAKAAYAAVADLLKDITVAPEDAKKAEAASRAVSLVSSAFDALKKLNEGYDGKGGVKPLDPKKLAEIAKGLKATFLTFEEVFLSMDFGTTDTDLVKKLNPLNMFADTVQKAMSAVSAFTGMGKDVLSATNVNSTLKLFKKSVADLLQDLAGMSAVFTPDEMNGIQSLLGSVASIFQAFASLAQGLKGNTNGAYNAMDNFRKFLVGMVDAISAFAADEGVAKAVDSLVKFVDRAFEIFTGDKPKDMGRSFVEKLVAGIEEGIRKASALTLNVNMVPVAGGAASGGPAGTPAPGKGVYVGSGLVYEGGRRQISPDEIETRGFDGKTIFGQAGGRLLGEMGGGVGPKSPPLTPAQAKAKRLAEIREKLQGLYGSSRESLETLSKLDEYMNPELYAFNTREWGGPELLSEKAGEAQAQRSKAFNPASQWAPASVAGRNYDWLYGAPGWMFDLPQLTAEAFTRGPHAVGDYSAALRVGASADALAKLKQGPTVEALAYFGLPANLAGDENLKKLFAAILKGDLTAWRTLLEMRAAQNAVGIRSPYAALANEDGPLAAANAIMAGGAKLDLGPSGMAGGDKVKMALGGIAMQPTPALIAEAGVPEAVVPLNRLGEVMRQGGYDGGAGAPVRQAPLSINIDGQVIRRLVVEALKDEIRIKGN